MVRPEVDFIHRPLQSQRSIRVLELLPGKVGAPLRCHIAEVSLDNPPPYEALSYAWGAPELVKGIACNSETIRITRSCSFALHHLRKSKKPRTLWIDAVCIDQKSPNERNHQVGMMHEVYSKARRVVLWLGRGEQGGWYDSNGAMRYIRGTVKRSRVGSWSKHEGLDKEKISDLNLLFGQPWFQRVWPVQEVALSRDSVMLLGNSYIDVEDLMTFLSLTQELTFTEEKIDRVHLHRQMWRYVQHVRRNYNSRQKITNCTRMLLRTRPQIATDPRDKIFAFHGLLELLGAHFPPPDYSKPVAQVYREAAATAIRHDNSLLILSSLTGETKLNGLPTWVPDWSDSGFITEVAKWEEEHGAGSDSIQRLKDNPGQAQYDISSNCRLLTLHGAMIETIEETSLAFPEERLLQDDANIAEQLNEVKVLQQWIDQFKIVDTENMVSFFTKFAQRARKRTHTDQLFRIWVQAIQKLAKATIGGAGHSTSSRTVNRNLVDIALRLYKHDQPAIDTLKNLMPLHTIIRKLLDRKMMFRTKTGRLGVGCQSLLQGDRIAFFAGCNLPMIVRRDRYSLHRRFVSPAHLDGVTGTIIPYRYPPSLLRVKSYTFA